MLTTSSFHGERIRTALLIGLVAGAASGCVVRTIPPDAPRQAAAEPAAKLPPALNSSAYEGTLEITSVRVRRLDATLEGLAGPAFMKEATEPFAIEVVTMKPLPREPRATSAVIILNGEGFPDTWTVLPDRLIVFIPDRKRIRDTNTVAAAWLGAEGSSMSRRVLTFRAQDVGK